MFGTGQTAAASGALAIWPTGAIWRASGPTTLRLTRHLTGALQFDARVIVTEITGSETFVHLDHHGDTGWGWCTACMT